MVSSSICSESNTSLWSLRVEVHQKQEMAYWKFRRPFVKLVLISRNRSWSQVLLSELNICSINQDAAKHFSLVGIHIIGHNCQKKSIIFMLTQVACYVALKLLWRCQCLCAQGVAITQENSLLDNTARIEGWLTRFPMFDWVGGRTSEMSAVGLLAAALQVDDITNNFLFTYFLSCLFFMWRTEPPHFEWYFSPGNWY